MSGEAKSPVTPGDDDDAHELVRAQNEEALLADGFESALIGVCNRFGQPALAAYDRAKCEAILVERDGMSEEEAEEFFDFNVIGAWMGEHTPVFLDLPTPGASSDRERPSKL